MTGHPMNENTNWFLVRQFLLFRSDSVISSVRLPVFVFNSSLKEDFL